jgi:hypothetical protein
VKIAYADPPYPGMAKKHYDDHPDYAGEVDHAELIERLARDYDGWLLHTSSTALAHVLPLCPPGVRIGAWVKPFAAFKRNVPLAYAWEPVIFAPARAQVVSGSIVMRDWVAEGITMKRGLVGAKPELVVLWALRCVGAIRDDDIDDLYPGSGAVQYAIDRWRAQTSIDDLGTPTDRVGNIVTHEHHLDT